MSFAMSLRGGLVLAAAVLVSWTAPALQAQPRTWTGNFIWDRPTAPERNAYTYFRKSFSLAAPPSAATVFMTADSRYQLFVNGIRVGRGPVRAPAGRLYYDTYDIRSQLRAGENVIAAVVHFFGEGNETYLLGKGALLLEADILPAAGQPLIRLLTDSSWRALRSSAWNPAAPRENDSNGFMEIFDFRQEPSGWKTFGFDDSSWTAPVLMGVPPQQPWPQLVPRDIPTLLETDYRLTSVVSSSQVTRRTIPNPLLVAEQVHAETLESPSAVEFSNLQSLVTRTGPAATVRTPTPGKDAVVVVDFGRVIAGFPYVDIEGPPGAVVDVTFGEWLTPDGRVPAYRAPVRFFTYLGPPMYTTDRIILGAGRQRWQRFFHSGMRYLQLTVRDAPSAVTVHQAGAVFHTYPYVTRGSFRASDPVLGAVWNTGAYTVQLSTADVIMDCPWREKGQWIDMVAPTANYYAFGDRAIVTRFLRTTSFTQDAEGRMYFPYPSTFAFEMPDQTMWWGMNLWSYYLHTGDAALLNELYPVVARAEAWFKSHKSSRGLLDVNWPFTGQRLLWPWVDHGHRFPNNLPGFKLGEMAALDAFHYKFLKDASSIALVANRPADAAQYEADAAQLKTDFNNAYFDAATDRYWDDPSRTISGPFAGTLAVLYGLAPANRSAAIVNQVLDSNFILPGGSPHFYSFLLDAFARSGQPGKALDTIRARWASMLGRGATTLWEKWWVDYDLFGQPFQPGENHNISLVHGYSAGPTTYLSTTVLGVRPLAAGFLRFAVAPEPSGLEWAEGSVPTPFGRVQVSWRVNQAPVSFNLTAVIPTGTLGLVSLPRQPNDRVSVNGVTLWQSGQATGTLAGFRVLGAVGNRVIIESPPGVQQFVAQ